MSMYSCHWKNPKFSVKMSTRESSGYSGESEEEEELVRRIGGKGQNLVQAVLRVRRERAGRTLPNWLDTRNNGFRPGEEVGSCGLEDESRLGGFQARETDRPRHRIRWARARPSTPFPT